MVDMAYGLCENYFMERVQAKQVRLCFGCSVAAGFIDSEGDTQYIFFSELKNVWGTSLKGRAAWEDDQKIRSNPNGHR